MPASPSKPSPYHHGDLREALVATGLAILEEGGDPSALSLREAARRAGVSAMAPYRHFADKDALLAAVATKGFERLRAALRMADEARDEAEALVGQGIAYIAFARANPALFRLMFGTPPGVKPEELTAAGAAAYAVMADRVAALAPPDEARERALQCWATAHGLAALTVDGRLDRFGDPEPLARSVLSLSLVPLKG